MKNTCKNCKFWRIKSDTRGICCNPDWRVRNSTSEEWAMKFIDELPNTKQQKINIVRELLGIRTDANFGCNQYEINKNNNK